MLQLVFVIIPHLAFPALDYHSQYEAEPEAAEDDRLGDPGTNVPLALKCSIIYSEESKETGGAQLVLDFFMGTVRRWEFKIFCHREESKLLA